MASLVYGIIGLFFCGIIFGLLAISKSNSAREAMRADPRLGGERLCGCGYSSLRHFPTVYARGMILAPLLLACLLQDGCLYCDHEGIVACKEHDEAWHEMEAEVQFCSRREVDMRPL